MFNWTIIYGFYERLIREDIWRYLDEIYSDSIPWLVQGDFNIVLRPDYKLGGRDLDMDSSGDFENCIIRNGLS